MALLVAVRLVSSMLRALSKVQAYKPRTRVPMGVGDHVRRSIVALGLVGLQVVAEPVQAEGVIASGLRWHVHWASCEADSAEEAATCATSRFSGGSAACLVAGAPPPYPVYPYQWDSSRYSADGQTFFFRIVHPCSGASPTEASATLDACPVNSRGFGSRCICNAGWTAITSISQPRCARIVHVDKTAAPPLTCQANPALGNPVMPSTGTKRQVVKTGISLAGVDLELVFDNTLLLRRRSADASIIGFDLLSFDVPGLGGAWSSTWHRRLIADASGQAASVVRGDGSVEVFRPDGSGRFVSAAPIQGGLLVATAGAYLHTDVRRTSIDTYDGDGRLVTTQLAQGPALHFTYSNDGTPASIAPGAGYLIGATDSSGRSVHMTYSAEGTPTASPVRLSTIRDPLGRLVRLEWSSQGEALRALVWQDESRRQFHADDPAHPWALTGITDEGLSRLATYGYDSKGRAYSTHQGDGIANGHWVDYGADGPRDSFSDHYDAATGLVFRVRGWTASGGISVQWPSGASSTMQFASVNGAIGLSSATQPAGSGCAASLVYVGYDASGRPDTFVDANGYRTCVAYDNRGLESMRTEGLPAAGASCASISASVNLPGTARRTAWSYHPVWALPVRRAEPGRITAHVYHGQPDPFTGATAACAPAGSVLPDGSPIAVLCRRVEQATTDADGSLGLHPPLQQGVPAREQRWTYDARGRVLSESDPLGHTTLYMRHATTSFSGNDPDAVGHTAGDLAATINAVGHTTNFFLYDRVGNWLQLTDPNGVPTTRTFDARIRLSSQSTAGQPTSYEYWPMGLLKKLTQPDGSYLAFGYDAAHRLTSVEDQQGNRITYALDGSGGRVAEAVTDPSGALRRSVQRSFDALGRVQQVIGREP